MKRLYFAAPLFTPSERSFNAELAETLARRFSVFLPQRDGVLIPGANLDRSSFGSTARIVYEADRSALLECDVLFAILDGRTIDEGVAFELGFASALGKQCIGLKTDARVLLPYGDNPMISGAISHLFTTVESVEIWLSGITTY